MNERDRLVKIMQSEQLSARQFSQEIGISPGALSNIMGGRNKPSLEVLQAVLRRYRAINCDWLIMGVGNMYITGGGHEDAILPFDEHEHKEEIVEQQPIKTTATSIGSSDNKKIDKILIFYSDGTFEER